MSEIIDYACSTCNFIWIIRLPDGRLIEQASGKLKNLNNNMEYVDPDLAFLLSENNIQGILLGVPSEFLGGNLGKLITCLKLKYPEFIGQETEILIEGRWKNFILR